MDEQGFKTKGEGVGCRFPKSCGWGVNDDEKFQKGYTIFYFITFLQRSFQKKNREGVGPVLYPPYLPHWCCISVKT